MQPQRTDNLPLRWRVWHAFNYNFGAVSFLFGSVLLFPYFNDIFDSEWLSAWLYTWGSLTFCFGDFTEWAHYQNKVKCQRGAQCCRFPSLSINFFLSFTGSVIYFIGSALFIPEVNQATKGLTLFIIGSAVIVISQLWKLSRTISEGRAKKAVWNTIKQDLNGFLVDVFAMLGALMYFSGSFPIFDGRAEVREQGYAVFVCGGAFFYLSGAFMVNRYFLTSKNSEGSLAIASSQGQFDQTEQMDAPDSN